MAAHSLAAEALRSLPAWQSVIQPPRNSTLSANGVTTSSSRQLSRRLLLQSGPVVAQASRRPHHASSTNWADEDASENGENADKTADDEETRKQGRDEEGKRTSDVTRRNALVCASVAATWQIATGFLDPEAALARDRRQKTSFPEEDYVDAGNGLRYFDIETGSGKTPEKGEQVKVHFEVRYGPLTVVSTRESKLLGGNRSISQPYLFVLGAAPYAERRRDQTSESANGLFSAQAAPKPPRALYTAVLGMKIGGKRSVLVPTELAYGDKGYNEVPPGAPIQMIIDLLDINDLE